jgi:DNA-3-methyladenine glycosylase I
MGEADTESGPGAVRRCRWAGSDPLYLAYHDHEWGRPVKDDARLYEKLCLEGFQAGLSWITILRKRDRFREVFCDFDFDRVAAMGEADVERLLGDAGIVRHRGKIESALNNARKVRELRDEFGSFARYIWRFEPEPVPPGDGPVAETAASRALSKDLRKRGFSFVGPTTCYAFMQAMGLVDDHAPDCFCRAEVEAARAVFARP